MKRVLRAQWRLVAFITRYSATPLSEVLRLTTAEANTYAEALAEIIKEENAPRMGQR